MSDCPTPQRREQLREARKALFKLPKNEWYELAGHPTVYYELRDYREHPMGKEEGIKTARSDINFMFKAFETGQVSLEATRVRRDALSRMWPRRYASGPCTGLLMLAEIPGAAFLPGKMQEDMQHGDEKHPRSSAKRWAP
jgi:hypothetical protein